MLETNLSIGAGLRWLHRKKELLESRLRREVTWDETIRDYKGLRGKSQLQQKRVLETFEKYRTELLDEASTR